MVSKPIVTAKKYCIDVSVKDMLRILKLDKTIPHSCQLIYKLEELNCCEVEYDGHFGPHIFYTLMVEFDTEENQESIRKCIEDFIKQKMPRGK